MPRSYFLIGSLLILPVTAIAHDNQSEISTHGQQTCITSNGAPTHDMGEFPNRANPNAFTEQTLRFCFPSNPELANETTYNAMTVGVTLSGVPIRPYTAGYYDPNGRRHNIGPNPDSGWRQQAMHAPNRLGMDAENAHVDKAGLYHYHAMSPTYAADVGSHIGFAPDGFEIHYAGETITSSWQLKSGERPTPPYGNYDGLFEEDFEYLAGSGDLDECNGTLVDGVYRYYATDAYPYFPRCFKGTIEGRFMTRR